MLLLRLLSKVNTVNVQQQTSKCRKLGGLYLPKEPTFMCSYMIVIIVMEWIITSERKDFAWCGLLWLYCQLGRGNVNTCDCFPLRYLSKQSSITLHPLNFFPSLSPSLSSFSSPKCSSYSLPFVFLFCYNLPSLFNCVHAGLFECVLVWPNNNFLTSYHHK
jgi:hypothetical protein